MYIGSIPVPASKEYLFRLSSAVEQSAVNRLVACSNQAAGAKIKSSTFTVEDFFCVRLSDENRRSLFNQGEEKNYSGGVIFDTGYAFVNL